MIKRNITTQGRRKRTCFSKRQVINIFMNLSIFYLVRSWTAFLFYNISYPDISICDLFD